MTFLTGLTLVDKKQLWDKIGFAVQKTGDFNIGGTQISIKEGGSQGWEFSGDCDKVVDICGIPTTIKKLENAPEITSNGPASGIDHVVVRAENLNDFKTSFYNNLKINPRKGPVSIKGRSIMFYLVKNTVLEVLESPSSKTVIMGITFCTTNSKNSRDYISERGCAVSPARASYQNKERFIFTVREHTNGMKTPVAFIDERQKKSKM